MGEYYEMEVPFKQRYPSVRVAWDGFLVGTLAAPAISAAIGFFMWAGGADFVFALEVAAKLTFFLLVAFGFGLPAIFVLKYYGRVTRVETTLFRDPMSPGANQTGPFAAGLEPPTGSPANLIHLIKDCAIEMARLKSEGQEPTREFMTRQFEQFNQPIWNSARQLLQTAGVINGKSWASLDLSKVRMLIGRIEITDDDKITIPHIGSPGRLRFAHVSVSPGDTNSYLDV